MLKNLKPQNYNISLKNNLIKSYQLINFSPKFARVKNVNLKHSKKKKHFWAIGPYRLTT